jgi:flagellin-like hook-associated protein FlgL
VTYNGDENFPGIPLPDGQTLKVGLDGKSITQAANSDYFGTLTSIRDQLAAGSLNAGPALDKLNEMENHLLQKRAEAGSAARYVEGLQSSMAAEQSMNDSQLTEQTGMDLSTGITQLLQNETEQQASMSVVGRQAKLSLVDYLR